MSEFIPSTEFAQAKNMYINQAFRYFCVGRAENSGLTANSGEWDQLDVAFVPLEWTNHGNGGWHG